MTKIYGTPSVVSRNDWGSPTASLRTSATPRVVYEPSPSIVAAAKAIEGHAAYQTLEPRNPVTNNLISAASNLMPPDVGRLIAKYAEPLGADVDGTLLYPRLTGTDAAQEIGNILDAHARTRFEDPLDPAQPTGAHVLIKQMFPEGATRLQKVVDGNPVARTFRIMGHNLTNYPQPTHASFTTTGEISKVAGLLAHLAQNPLAFTLLNQQGEYSTVIGSGNFRNSRPEGEFHVMANTKYVEDFYYERFDIGTIGHDHFKLPPGSTLIEIRQDVLNGANNASFSALLRGGSNLTSNLTDQFVAAMKLSRAANGGGDVKPLSSYLAQLRMQSNTQHLAASP